MFTLPVAGVLRRAFPQARIDFLVEKPSDQIVRLNPHIRETLVYEKDRPLFWIQEVRRRHYDWVLDFHSNGRTLFLTFLSGAKVRAGLKGPISRRLVYTHMVETSDAKYLPEQKLDVLRALGVPAESWSWDVEVPEEEILWADGYLRSVGVDPQSPIIGLAPATRRPIREWKEDRFAAVAEDLIKNRFHILFLWGPGEKDLVERVSRLIKLPKETQSRVLIPPEIPLIKLAALIRKCAAVVGVDNGPKNMAVTLSVPSLTLSGPTNPLSFDPHQDPLHPVLRDEKLFCISCGLNQCPYHHECMENISAESVLRSLKKLLSVGQKAVGV